ncbi:MAG: hypothetical protein VCA34_03670 [Roseibacillus sp.]
MNNVESGVRWLVILGVFGLIGCAGPKGAVHIRQFHLRALASNTGGVGSIRAENLKRLHGAVSTEEQRNRLGHYYTIKWDGPTGRENEPVRIVFRYRQAATGSEILRMESTAPGGRKGKVELRLIGPAYLEGGHVLSWHMSFYRGGDLIETRQSYLWE